MHLDDFKVSSIKTAVPVPIFVFSIITQVIIEILMISLVEDYVISRYNHLTRGDYSGSTNFQTAAWRFVDVSEKEI